MAKRTSREPTSILEVLEQNNCRAWEESGACKQLLRQQLCHLCYHSAGPDARCLDSERFASLTFPGCQPVSMDKDNLRHLVDVPGGYYVCEKTDGFRALLYVGDTPNALHLIDRSGTTKWNVLRFDLASPALAPPSGTRVALVRMKNAKYNGKQGVVQPHDGKSGMKLLDAATSTMGVSYRVLLDGDTQTSKVPAGKVKPVGAAAEAAAQLALPAAGRGGRFHRQTVIDGEIVVDVVQDPDGTRRRVLRFYAFDLLVLGGVNTMGCSLAVRMRLLEQSVVAPLRAAETAAATAAGAPVTASLSLPFELLLKDMYHAQRNMPSLAHCSVAHVWNTVVPRLPHECDGLIFTPIEQAYVPGKSDLTLLKWKPEQSVDFMLGNEGVQRLADGRPCWPLYVFHQGQCSLCTAITFHANPAHSLTRVLPRVHHVIWSKLYVFCQGIMVAKPRSYLIVDASNEAELQRCSAGVVVECIWRRDARPVVRTAGTLAIDATRRGGWAFLKVRDDKGAPNALWVVERVEKSIANDIQIATISARLAGRVEAGPSVDEVLASCDVKDCYAESARYSALATAGWAKPPARPKLSAW